MRSLGMGMPCMSAGADQQEKTAHLQDLEPNPAFFANRKASPTERSDLNVPMTCVGGAAFRVGRQEATSVLSTCL